MLSSASRRFSLMMIVPSIASLRSLKVKRTMLMTRCMRSISCRRKMFIGDRDPIFWSLKIQQIYPYRTLDSNMVCIFELMYCRNINHFLQFGIKTKSVLFFFKSLSLVNFHSGQTFEACALDEKKYKWRFNLTMLLCAHLEYALEKYQLLVLSNIKRKGITFCS